MDEESLSDDEECMQLLGRDYPELVAVAAPLGSDSKDGVDAVPCQLRLIHDF